MTLRVDVKPELLRWARERAGIEPEALVRRFPKYREWERGENSRRSSNLSNSPRLPMRRSVLSFFRNRCKNRSPFPTCARWATGPSADPASTCSTPCISASNARIGTGNSPVWRPRTRCRFSARPRRGAMSCPPRRKLERRWASTLTNAAPCAPGPMHCAASLSRPTFSASW